MGISKGEPLFLSLQGETFDDGIDLKENFQPLFRSPVAGMIRKDENSSFLHRRDVYFNLPELLKKRLLLSKRLNRLIDERVRNRAAFDVDDAVGSFLIETEGSSSTFQLDSSPVAKRIRGREN